MGRLLAFMARLAQDGRTPAARAIAVDELTAVLVDAQGSANVVDQRPADQRGSACFLQAPGLPELCQPGQPLLFEDVSVYQMRAGDVDASFDLATWQGRGGQAYSVSARAGAVCAPVTR
jgi:cyanophycinase